jgi:hypothetical protein
MIDMSVGTFVTYYDSDNVPYNALVTWVHDDVVSEDPPMVNCVRGDDYNIGGDEYGHKVVNETSVQYIENAPSESHAYELGWRA